MAEPEKTTVLVADDEPSTLALVAGHLRTKGYQVIEASDGDQAWELACDHLPDIVVLDVMMPGMSGWEVCRKIRETVELAHTGVDAVLFELIQQYQRHAFAKRVA